MASTLCAEFVGVVLSPAPEPFSNLLFVSTVPRALPLAHGFPVSLTILTIAFAICDTPALQFRWRHLGYAVALELSDTLGMALTVASILLPLLACATIAAITLALFSHTEI